MYYQSFGSYVPAFRFLTQVNAHIHLGLVSPHVIPNIIRKQFRSIAAFRRVCTGKHAVDVGVETRRISGKEIALVQVDTMRVYYGYADNYTELITARRFLPRGSYLCH